MTIINIIILLIVILFCSSCKLEDKNGNNIFVPDFIENWNKNKEVNKPVEEVKVVIQPKPSPMPKKPVAVIVTPKISEGEVKLNKGLSEQDRIIKNAEKYVGEIETEGFNRSPFINKINKFTGVPAGSAYCASFVSYILYISDVNAPISAWSPDTTSRNNIPFKDINTSDVFGLYFPSKKRIAHTGFIKEAKKNSAHISTTEANTSPNADELGAKSREGDGVFNKSRNKKLMSDSRNKFSRYWK